MRLTQLDSEIKKEIEGSSINFYSGHQVSTVWAHLNVSEGYSDDIRQTEIKLA